MRHSNLCANLCLSFSLSGNACDGNSPLILTTVLSLPSLLCVVSRHRQTNPARESERESNIDRRVKSHEGGLAKSCTLSRRIIFSSQVLLRLLNFTFSCDIICFLLSPGMIHRTGAKSGEKIVTNNSSNVDVDAGEDEKCDCRRGHAFTNA